MTFPIPVSAPFIPNIPPGSRESIILLEGSTETLNFQIQWRTDLYTNPTLSYTLEFDSVNYPFWGGNKIIPEGLKVPNQLERFEITQTNITKQAFSLDLTIHSVCVEEEDIYKLVVIIFGNPGFSRFESIKDVQVYSPPGKAMCFIALSDWVDHLHEVHCHAPRGHGNASISCFQNGDKLPIKDTASHDDSVMRAVFWMMTTDPVSCCSHGVGLGHTISQDSCDHFQWPFKPDGHLRTPSTPPLENTYKYESNESSTNEPGSGSQMRLELINKKLIAFLVYLSVNIIQLPIPTTP